MTNLDTRTVESFGKEWVRFDQTGLTEEEQRKIFDDYFSIFPWDSLPAGAAGVDVGCGSGRWAAVVAPRVGHLHCLDASAEALEVARQRLSCRTNISFHHASVGAMPWPPGSMDFCYSLGVLHHVPDTAAAVAACARLLKPGAPMLLYLYYALDDRPWWFRGIWHASNLVRKLISRLPDGPKTLATDIIAVTTYLPLARLALVLERLGARVGGLPLAYYRHHSFYTMRTDARDRFGTPLEQRFELAQIKATMAAAGLQHIVQSDQAPFWCVLGFKA